MLPALVPVLVMAFNLSPELAGQQPSHCAQNIFCLFNQEAALSDPAGIHKYSEDLTGLIVPPEAGKADIQPLANRLARAELMVRTGKGKLVPEANVVRAFNELMQEVGAPSSLRTDEASIHRFREHAASIKAFPALFSANRNGKSCNPGEAVFLLGLLISDNGVLLDGNLDTAVALMQGDGQQGEGEVSFAVARIEVLGSGANRLLFSYSSHHGRNSTVALFNRVAGWLGL
jgi:hypothetical protein